MQMSQDLSLAGFTRKLAIGGVDDLTAFGCSGSTVMRRRAGTSVGASPRLLLKPDGGEGALVPPPTSHGFADQGADRRRMRPPSHCHQADLAPDFGIDQGFGDDFLMGDRPAGMKA